MHEEAVRLISAAQEEGRGAEEVIALCSRAFEFAPNAVEIFHVILQKMARIGNLRASGDIVREAIKLYPSDPEIIEAFARWQEFQGNFDVAASYWVRLARVSPHFDPHKLGLARALMFANDLQGAVSLLRPFLEENGSVLHRAVSIAYAIVGEAMLKSGNPDGFQYYLHRIWANAGFYEVPEVQAWHGQEIAGKKLLITHHLGYGDQMLLASLLPHFVARGVQVCVMLDHGISSLVQHALPQVSVCEGNRACVPHQAPDPALQSVVERFRPDYQTTLLHLPAHVTRESGGNFPQFSPYISVPLPATQSMEPVVNALRKAAGGRRLIGIAWDCAQRVFAAEQGEYVASFSERRSIPTEVIATLMDDPEIAAAYHFVALHPQPHFEAITVPLPRNLSVIGRYLGRFSDTSAIIAACDAVVSCDMSMANLAALMGKELTLMLQHEGEWRFGIAGDRSPWFAEPLCFRQVIPGDWSPVMTGVRNHLLQCVSGVRTVETVSFSDDARLYAV
jgi:hypothetical protein